MNYNFVAGTSASAPEAAYTFDRIAISIQHDANLVPPRKDTMVHKDFSATFKVKHAGVSTLDFTCAMSPMGFHPGINGIYQFLSQSPFKLAVKVDVGYSGNPCRVGQELFRKE